MKYVALILFSFYALEIFSQNDDLMFKKYWSAPDSEINIPLLIESGDIAQLTSQKIGSPIDIIVFSIVNFNKDLWKRSIFSVESVELHHIMFSEHIWIYKYDAKNDFQLFLWNLLTEKLLKWYYVQPYNTLSESWKKNWYIPIPSKMFMARIQLRPA